MPERNGSGLTRSPRTSPQRKNVLRELTGYRDEELAQVDPVELNLLFAKEIPSLAQLDIPTYQRTVDEWSNDFRHRLMDAELHFWESPCDWDNDVHLFRLGQLCQFLGEILGIRYKEDQKDLSSIVYTDPSDLFINGVIDTCHGTCGNMAVLFQAITWRLKWPVYLIVANSHKLCRFDNGYVRHNIEATNFENGFRVPPDQWLQENYRISDSAVRYGSDLCSLTPKQVLGCFYGLRGRHFRDIGQVECAEQDYLVARGLFPVNRLLYCEQMSASIQLAGQRFDPDERGHPVNLAKWILWPEGEPQTSTKPQYPEVASSFQFGMKDFR